MQFIIVARDYKDNEALKRRLKEREAHIALSDKAIKTGQQIFGGAMLDEDNQMCGSVMVVDFPSREKIDEWLKNEPYVTGEVWEDIEVMSYKVGPSFEHMIK